MSPKATGLRAGAELHRPKVQAGAMDPIMDVDFPRRIGFRDTGAGRLAKYTAGERRAIEARLWAKVKKTDSCWLWTGPLDKDGYGQLGVKFGQTPASLKVHRLAWELTYGPIPKPLQLNHRCDVRHCLRAEHLYLGTQQENLTDARRRGGLNERRARTRALSLGDRLAIYHMPDRRGLSVELAVRYRVTKTTIHHTRAGRFVGSPVREAVR